MKKSLLYIIIFIALQLLITVGISVVLKYFYPETDSQSAQVLTITSITINVIVIILFLSLKWYRVGRDYIQTRPWVEVFWTILLGIGIIIPLAFIEEMIPEAWRKDSIGEVLIQMLQTPEGYFAVCMLAPLAEEIVFRGAIITALSRWIRDKEYSAISKTWVPIIISACFFSAIHFNLAQIPHAFIMGLLLGWLFTRTGSLLLCFLVHWINNSFAYVFAMLFPSLPIDAPLVDYFGSNAAVYQAVVCSLMIALPSLYQLNRVLKKENAVPKSLFFVLMMLFVTNGVSAEDKVMSFEEKEGHYFVDITVAGTKMQAILETGANAFNMTEDFYEAHKDELNLKVKPVKKGVVSELGTKKGYEVLYIGRGSFSVGEVLYRGPVIVTDRPMTYQFLPVQCLHHPSDTSSIMIVNQVKQNITFKEKNFRYELAEGKWQAFPLHKQKKDLRPFLTTVARVELNHHEYAIQGEFIVDMGNPNHLVLSENNEQVAAMMEAEEESVKKRRDDKGGVKGFALKSERLKLCGNTFHDVNIPIKPKYISPNAKWTGLIGLRAFRGQYAFDWGRKTMYIKK